MGRQMTLKTEDRVFALVDGLAVTMEHSRSFCVPRLTKHEITVAKIYKEDILEAHNKISDWLVVAEKQLAEKQLAEETEKAERYKEYIENSESDTPDTK